jgi:predicted nucleotidyltransferase
MESLKMTQRAEFLARLCQKYEIDALYAFGSRASDVKAWLENKHPVLPPSPSDVDIGINPTSGERFSVRKKVQLALALEDILDVQRVDLVSLQDADPFLAANVIRGERLYARDSRQADEYELYVLRRAGDLAPLERERLALILGEQK